MAEHSDDRKTESVTAAPTASPVVPPHVGRDLGLYVLARFGLVAAVAAVLTLINVPLLISIAVGLIVGVPLSMVVLRGWHERVAAGLAARGAVRRAARDELRAELRGDGHPGGVSPDAG
ncbi:MAG TPA: DUF4229 domain-containing protein [Pseudonocardiaceae bacterium]|nr:DUF4229 domain-containing protein [Pseudonocardiaceae bacterium]